MKKITSLFIALVICFGLIGCSNKEVDPYNVFGALTSKINYFNKSELIYTDDESRYNELLAEFNNLVKQVSELELKEESQTVLRDKYLKKAAELIKSIEETRKIMKKSAVKEKNGDYSLINDCIKLIHNHDMLKSELYDIFDEIMPFERAVNDNARAQKMDIYYELCSDVTSMVYGLSDYRHELIGKYRDVTTKDLANWDKKINDAQKAVDDLKKVAVDEKDQELKDQKEKALQAVIDLINKERKKFGENEMYENNLITAKINILESDIYAVNLYSKIDYEPYLPIEE